MRALTVCEISFLLIIWKLPATTANTWNLATIIVISPPVYRSSHSTNVPSNNSKGDNQPRDVIKCYKFIHRKVVTIDGILARKIGRIGSFTAIHFAKKSRLLPLILHSSTCRSKHEKHSLRFSPVSFPSFETTTNDSFLTMQTFLGFNISLLNQDEFKRSISGHQRHHV